jgi:hypothetical protein
VIVKNHRNFPFLVLLASSTIIFNVLSGDAINASSRHNILSYYNNLVPKKLPLTRKVSPANIQGSSNLVKSHSTILDLYNSPPPFHPPLLNQTVIEQHPIDNNAFNKRLLFDKAQAAI